MYNRAEWQDVKTHRQIGDKIAKLRLNPKGLIFNIRVEKRFETLDVNPLDEHTSVHSNSHWYGEYYG